MRQAHGTLPHRPSSTPRSRPLQGRATRTAAPRRGRPAIGRTAAERALPVACAHASQRTATVRT